MKLMLRLVLGLGLVLALARGAQADPVTFTFGFTAGNNAGFGTLFADFLSGNTFGIVTSDSSLTITTGAYAGTYHLQPSPNGADPSAVFTSPLGLFLADNRLYAPGNPILDTYGLLFMGTGGETSSEIKEINLWGNGPNNYSFYVGTPTGYQVQVDTFSDFKVPDGGATLMLLGGALAALGAVRRRLAR
jgi:hypothetical protein